MKKHIFLLSIFVLLFCLILQFSLSARNPLFLEFERNKETSKIEKSELKEYSKLNGLFDIIIISCLSNHPQSFNYFSTLVFSKDYEYTPDFLHAFFNHSPPTFA